MNVVPLVTTEEGVDTWEAFWVLYPRHEAKKDAMKAWGKIDGARHVEILTALVEWRKVLLDREVQYRPLPASWLRGERWEDELPKEYQPRAAAHQEFAPATKTERAPMPEHVKALIAKLRGK